MTRTLIPDDIRRFILMHIPSVPYLEAILLLRADTANSWDPVRVARHLYMNDAVATGLLADLQTAGIVVPIRQEPVAFRYQPGSPELGQVIDRLAEVYASNLVDVTHLIHAKTGRKAQQFADAFVWRKDI